MADIKDSTMYLSSVPIETSFLLVGKDNLIGEASNKIEVTRENLHDLAMATIKAYPEEFQGKPFCIISGATEPGETFSNAEHFVPEGLGFGWTALPRGTGTCDRINAIFGEYELEWLRFGSMGIYRPFFVGKGKDDAPEFYAPKKTDSVFQFKRDENGNRVIILTSDKKLPTPEPDKSGRMVITVPVTRPSSAAISLSLHKMAYLAIWLSNPGIIFDSAFVPLLTFLNNLTAETYRPYTEQMIAGAEPGVSLRFLVHMREKTEERGNERRVFAIERIFAAIRAHHLLYFLSLVGNLSDMPQDGLTPQTYVPIGSGRKTTTGFSVHFDRIVTSADDERTKA